MKKTFFLSIITLMSLFTYAQTFTANGVTFELIQVDGGKFKMGGTKEQEPETDILEKPVHIVELNSFSIGKYEVTQELWESVMLTNPSNNKGKNLPVENVSWTDCAAFILKLNQITGQQFRLPTEAEWEYAARGGKKTKKYKYAGSNKIQKAGWCWVNSGDKKQKGDKGFNSSAIRKNNCKSQIVGQLIPNELGIYDMSGNVREWVNDYYGYYDNASQQNPTGPLKGNDKIWRGGSWYDLAELCRVAARGKDNPERAIDNIGLRLAL